MGLFDFLRSSRARTPPKGVELDDHGLIEGVFTSRQPPRRGTLELARAYSRHPDLQRSVRVRAEGLAGVEWQIFKADTTQPFRKFRSLNGNAIDRLGLLNGGQGSVRELTDKGNLTEVEDHPILDLICKPNPEMSGHEFWKLYSKGMDLNGEFFLLKDTFAASGSGPVKSLWPVPSHQCTSTWSIADPRFQFSWRSWHENVAKDAVVWAKEWDTYDPFGRGAGLGEAIADTLELSEYADIMAKSRMYNRGMPDWILGIDNMDEDSRKAFEASWQEQNRGIGNAGRTAIVNRRIFLEKLAHTLVEEDWVEVRTFARDMIHQHFNVPPEILGIVENSNRATTVNAIFRMALFCTVPMAELMRAVLQRSLVDQHYGTEWVLDYVSPIPPDRDQVMAAMQAQAGAFSVDEWRESAMKQPLKEGGDLFFVSSGAETVESPAALLGTPDLPVATTAVDGDPKDSPEATTQTDGVEADAAAIAAKEEALSGAQVTSMVTIVSNVASGALPRDSGMGILTKAFNMSDEEAEGIMGSAGRDDSTGDIDETEVAGPVDAPTPVNGSAIQ